MQKQVHTLKLYSFFRSTASWRVRTVLALKNLKYEYIPVNLSKEEQRTSEYENINPMKVIQQALYP